MRIAEVVFRRAQASMNVATPLDTVAVRGRRESLLRVPHPRLQVAANLATLVALVILVGSIILAVVALAHHRYGIAVALVPVCLVCVIVMVAARVTHTVILAGMLRDGHARRKIRRRR